MFLWIGGIISKECRKAVKDLKGRLLEVDFIDSVSSKCRLDLILIRFALSVQSA